MTDINVLIVVGLRAGSVNRELAEVGAVSSADGIALNMFDSLTDLPLYSETFENRGTPSSVGALRTAAAEADAVLIVTTYHGRVPAVVHNAIDWLTRQWDQAALHDKPLAVIGRTSGCYSGVWSHQTEDADHIAGPRVIDSITVSNLREAIQKLASEVQACDALNSASSTRLQFGSPLLVKIRFGGALCAPAQGDGNLIHHRRERERTNRPHPHHDLCNVPAATQKPFIALQ